MVRCSIPGFVVLPFLFLLCANGHSPYTASSIDAVILTILKNEVSTPPSERHAIFSDELRRKIEPLLATDETDSEEEIRLLSDIEGNLARERFLFHLSMRSAVLFSSLDPFALNWSERTIDLGQDLKNFRIIRDAGWTEEFTQEMNVAPCFDVISVAKMVWKKGRNKNGEHEKRVKELAKVETQLPLDFVVVAQEKERGPMTIIDGNHRAIILAAMQQNYFPSNHTHDSRKFRLFVGTPSSDNRSIVEWKFWSRCPCDGNSPLDSNKQTCSS